MTKNHNQSTVTTEPSLYYKMYKAGKLWMYAGIMGAAVTGTTLINNGTAHADTTTGDTTSASSSSDTYTKIATPDSTVTNAASAATNAGATVTSTVGTTYNVSGASELAKAQSAVAQDYASQSQDLANATTQAQNSSSAATEVASTNEQIESAASALKATGATATQGDTKTITSVDQVSQMKTDAQTQINKMNSMASETTAVSNATAEANATVKSAADVANAVPNVTVTASGKTVLVSSVAQAQQLANQQKETIEAATKEQEDKNKKLSQEQTLTGNFNPTNGGNIDANINYTIAYHYNIENDTVTVDSVKINSITNKNPENLTNFIDSIVLLKPNGILPDVYGIPADQETSGSFDSSSLSAWAEKYGNNSNVTYRWSNGADVADLNATKETGTKVLNTLLDAIKNQSGLQWIAAVDHISDNPFSGTSSTDKDHYLSYINDNLSFIPYTVSRNDDGKFVLIKVADRLRTTNPLFHITNGKVGAGDLPNLTRDTIQYAMWNYGGNSISLDIPTTAITYDTYKYTPDATFTYNLYNSGITPPSANYHLDSIYYGQGADTKYVSDTQNGKITDVNGQQLTTGDQVTYKITADSLPAGRENDIQNLTYSDTLPDGMSVSDAKMVDASGNDVSGNFTKSVNGNAVSFTVTSDYLKALNADKSSVATLPVMEIVATVTKDSATLKNQAIVLVNNNSVTTNTTVNTSGTSTPTKSETANGGSQDANKMTLQRGDTINYKVDLDYKDIKANTAISDAQKAKGLSFSDTYDSKTTAKPETAKLVTADGTELPSGMYTLTWNTANHTVTGKITDVDSFIKAYGGQVLSLKFDAAINENVKDSEKVYNTAYQTNFGHNYQTNTVWNKVDVPSPTKSETVDDNTEDGNGKYVVVGDTIKYTVTVDYSGVMVSELTKDALSKEWSITDNYDAKTTADQNSIQLLDASGNTIDSSNYTVNWGTQNHTVKLTLSNPTTFLTKYGDQVLKLKFNAKVNENVEDGATIENTAFQTDAGHNYQTNTVTNKVSNPDPKKDVVVSVDNTKSLDNSTINLGDTFDYALEGVTIPQNYGGTLSEYGFQDDYDQEHDQYNGDYVVLATTDITLKDGTVLKKGTDLSKYTTQTIDQTNGEVDIEFDKSFLETIDLTKSSFGATAYVAMKRIKYGTVYNSYINTVNGIGKKSNTVVTNTPKPETPTPESPSTPATPTQTAYTPIETPATTVTPAQPQETLPQTGNEGSEAAEVAGAVMLGLVSMATLAGAARRKKREA